MKNRFIAIKGLILGLAVVAGVGLTGCSFVDNISNNIMSSIQAGRYGEYGSDSRFNYAMRTKDNTGYICTYYWDGTDDDRYIVMPDMLNDITINSVGGYFGNGNPDPFCVDIADGLTDKDVVRLYQIYNQEIENTEYIDFYLIADKERINKDDTGNVNYYEEATKTLYVSRVTVVDKTQIFTNTDDGRGLLPGITDIEEVTYRGEALGDDNDRVPGPTDYKFWGVAYISDEDAAEIASKYELEDCEVEIDAAIGALYRNLAGKEWKCSKELSRDLIKSGCSGDAYISGNVIYFAIFTN